jgi:hypothetical protein
VQRHLCAYNMVSQRQYELATSTNVSPTSKTWPADGRTAAEVAPISSKTKTFSLPASATATKIRLVPAAVFGPEVSSVVHSTLRVSLLYPDVSARFSQYASTLNEVNLDKVRLMSVECHSLRPERALR